MENLFFTLALALTAWLISFITGRGRRQVSKIPKGMGILCPPPGKRYVLYALGVLVFVFVSFFGVLYILDGAPKSARPMWGLCMAFAVITLVVCILGGNIMARECVYFNGEKLQIEKAFQKPQTYRWSEIRKISGSFDRAISLYLIDGTKILTADIGMVNYETFCAVLKAKCPAKAAEYYRHKAYEEPQKCVLRYGSEYYLLSIMGILMLLPYLAFLLSSDLSLWQQKLLLLGPSEWFSFLFAPVCGVAGAIALFVLCGTSIRYSREKLVMRYPLRRKREIFWRSIEAIEMVSAKKNGEKYWKTLRLYTSEGAFRLNLALLTHGKDGFMTMLFKMAEKYDIPCFDAKK